MCCKKMELCNNKIVLVGVVDEDFINYKKPSMTLEFPYCTLKCDKDSGVAVCQNSTLLHQKKIEVEIDKLINRYLNNPITEAIVFQGLEPMDSFRELLQFVQRLRIIHKCNDDVVIYTGYNCNEIEEQIALLANYQNVIIKFGRFIPNKQKHYDDILGVTLASPNQYAERIS